MSGGGRKLPPIPVASHPSDAEIDTAIAVTNDALSQIIWAIRQYFAHPTDNHTHITSRLNISGEYAGPATVACAVIRCSMTGITRTTILDLIRSGVVFKCPEAIQAVDHLLSHNRHPISGWAPNTRRIVDRQLRALLKRLEMEWVDRSKTKGWLDGEPVRQLVKHLMDVDGDLTQCLERVVQAPHDPESMHRLHQLTLTWTTTVTHILT